jgi:NTP pyrophosphatase (non-canonical NTP hydrolase)
MTWSIAWVEHHDELWGNSSSNVFDVENLLHSGIALNEEAGEVGGVIKKFHRLMSNRHGIQKGKEVTEAQLRTRLLEELVDVVIYRDKLLLMLGETSGQAAILFEQAWRKKFKELHERYGTEATDCTYCTGS